MFAEPPLRPPLKSLVGTYPVRRHQWYPWIFGSSFHHHFRQFHGCWHLGLAGSTLLEDISLRIWTRHTISARAASPTRSALSSLLSTSVLTCQTYQGSYQVSWTELVARDLTVLRSCSTVDYRVPKHPRSSSLTDGQLSAAAFRARARSRSFSFILASHRFVALRWQWLCHVEDAVVVNYCDSNEVEAAVLYH